jgi:hypothetical protein
MSNVRKIDTAAFKSGSYYEIDVCRENLKTSQIRGNRQEGLALGHASKKIPEFGAACPS